MWWKDEVCKVMKFHRGGFAINGATPSGLDILTKNCFISYPPSGRIFLECVIHRQDNTLQMTANLE